MTEIKYLKNTQDSAAGRIRSVSNREADILVTLGFASYHHSSPQKEKTAKSKKGDGNV